VTKQYFTFDISHRLRMLKMINDYAFIHLFKLSTIRAFTNSGSLTFSAF